MTDMQKVFNDMFRNSVGMERLMEAQKQIADVTSRINTSFPAYNIKKSGENQYEIEMAVAGYSIADISVELEKDVLTVSSKGHDVGDSLKDFLYQGFTYKGFTRAFTLDNTVRVVDAEMINGLLKVYLERLVPVEQKPKKINIRQPSKTSSKTLLNEDSSF